MERLYIAGSLFNEAEVNQRMYILRRSKIMKKVKLINDNFKYEIIEIKEGR